MTTAASWQWRLYWGGFLVCLCDLLARTLFSPYEIPVGIVLSLLGGPFFIYLVLIKGKVGLNG